MLRDRHHYLNLKYIYIINIHLNFIHLIREIYQHVSN